jgi:hypothetical protein
MLEGTMESVLSRKSGFKRYRLASERHVEGNTIGIFLAPHTSGPRGVPRCGALRRRTTGGVGKTAATLNVKLCDLPD